MVGVYLNKRIVMRFKILKKFSASNYKIISIHAQHAFLGRFGDESHRPSQHQPAYRSTDHLGPPIPRANNKIIENKRQQISHNRACSVIKLSTNQLVPSPIESQSQKKYTHNTYKYSNAI